MRYDSFVVGAGPAGIILAERLARKENKKVLIVEKRDHIGGNLYDHFNEHGILVHKYGPHFFRTDKENVWAYLSQFTDWHSYEHKVKASVKGMVVPFPINLDTYNSLFNTDLNQSQFQEVLSGFKFTDDPKNAEEAIINQVGEYLYECFFKNYTIKQWGKHPQELHADTVKRVPVRIDRENRYQLAKYQGLPQQGYTAMMKRMIDHPNIHLMLGVDYKEVRDSIEYEHMIYTGPLDYYFDFKLGQLEYRSLRFDEQTFQKRSYQDHAVINYPNNFDYTRITEYKKMTGQESPATTIHVEYPEAFEREKNDPYYPILSDNNLSMKDQYLDLAAQEKNVSFIGRLAEYRYYAMDDVVEAALELYEAKFKGSGNA